MSKNSDQSNTVFIVDDDPAIRHAMSLLMKSVGLDHQAFGSADEFLEHHNGEENGCIVLDIRMPGLGGLELQDRLIAMKSALPIIFITGHGDIPMAVEAMQKGAVDFIQKPFRDQELLDRITDALDTAEKLHSLRAQESEVRFRIDTLTNREQEVLEHVVTGKPNKIIAHELGVSQRTVEIHRARVMEKMKARSLAELVRMRMTIG